MDQIKIGRFIAERRKAQKMTQKALADMLRISDKTVSKWECGKGLPELSLMIPLCDALQITVNDLLSGTIVSPVEYQTKAEENMMALIKENSENKKSMALSIICGVITIIAVFALVCLASFMPLPMFGRIALIVLAVVAAVCGVGAACVLDVKAGYYECPHCKALFVPTMRDYVKGIHTLTRRRLTCPICANVVLCDNMK